MPLPRDMKALTKANMELEEMYLGIPDESVNLTFQDMAVVKQLDQKKKEVPAAAIQETHPLAKLPSLDFSRGLEAAYHNHQHLRHEDTSSHGGWHHHHHHHDNHHSGHHVDHHQDHDMSMTSMASTVTPDHHRGGGGGGGGGGRSRRPGIPHSNICTICSSYVYIFRHRCLVCGRTYCRDCVIMGMGEMAEGRKCIQCLGKRFSQRYIQRAGQVGCWSRYPTSVKQAELKWAENGPRRSGERAFPHSNIMSMTSRSPRRAHPATSSQSFASNSPFSSYSPNHHHFPL